MSISSGSMLVYRFYEQYGSCVVISASSVTSHDLSRSFSSLSNPDAIISITAVLNQIRTNGWQSVANIL